MRINHNIQALNAYRNLSQTMASTSKSLEKLSSGMRINRAADDAAGLAISEKMRSQIRGLGMAERNALDAVSLIQTAEGALNETHSILQRMRELSVQAANGTMTDEDRKAVQAEIDQLTFEIDRIADTTQFNQKKLFSGYLNDKAFAKVNSNDVKFENGVWKGNVKTDRVSIDFSEMPEAGDVLKIGDFEITFVDTDPADSQIDVASKDLETLLIEVKGKLDSTTNDNLKNSKVVGTKLILELAIPADGFDIEITDNKLAVPKLEELNLQFQIGANSSESLAVSLSIMEAASLGIGFDEDGKPTEVGKNAVKGVDVGTAEGAEKAIDLFDEAIRKISEERSKLGAYQNRLEHTVTNLQTANENLTAAESRIRDLDMALEMTNFTRNNILNQAGQAMLAQANQLPQGILQLLQ